MDKQWEHKGNKITLTHPFKRDTDGNTYMRFLVEANSGKDTFDFVIPLIEAVKYQNYTHETYIEKAVENIKHYIDLIGIPGNQSHIFDFVDSDFIPKENIDWP